MDIVDQIALRLPEYLKLRGVEVDTKGFALCPMGHDNKTRSFHLGGPSGDSAWWCFGCNKGGNIFTLASMLEGYPTGGSEFYQTTVPALANLLGLTYVPKVRTPQESKSSKIRDLLMRVRKELQITDTVKKWAEERGLDVALFSRLGIGMIPDSKSLSRKLNRNYTEEIRKESGIYHGDTVYPDLFNDRIIFTLFNADGLPVAFAGRLLSDTEGRAKYVNSMKSQFYDKSSYLYNYQFAKKHTHIYVTEGYVDVLRLTQNGMNNVVAVGGTSLTKQHLKILSKHQAVLALDGDKPGITRMSEIRKEVKSASSILIPKGHDPDSYIRNYGLDSFLRLEELDDLSWQIVTHAFHQPLGDAEAFLKKIEETNPVKHHNYLQKLAQRSGIEYRVLSAGLQRITNDRNWEVIRGLLDNKSSIQKLNVNITKE